MVPFWEGMDTGYQRAQIRSLAEVMASRVNVTLKAVMWLVYNPSL